MKIKTICAWCQCYISEGDFEVSEHCQAVAIDGVITSHGICKKCKTIVIAQYKLKLNRREKHGLV